MNIDTKNVNNNLKNIYFEDVLKITLSNEVIFKTFQRHICIYIYFKFVLRLSGKATACARDRLHFVCVWKNWFHVMNLIHKLFCACDLMIPEPNSSRVRGWGWVGGYHGIKLWPGPPQMLSHMCFIISVGIKPRDFTVLEQFYLIFAGRLFSTGVSRHLSACDSKAVSPLPLCRAGG